MQQSNLVGMRKIRDYFSPWGRDNDPAAGIGRFKEWCGIKGVPYKKTMDALLWQDNKANGLVKTSPTRSLEDGQQGDGEESESESVEEPGEEPGEEPDEPERVAMAGAFRCIAPPARRIPPCCRGVQSRNNSGFEA